MRTILLVEDSATARMQLVHWLQQDGWNVLEAEDGEAGLSLARQHRPEVIICDLLMPVLNGFQFCRALRAQDDGAGQPTIVVTTASDYESNRRNAFEAGANEYLVKPVDRNQLLRILASVPVRPESSVAPPAAESPRGMGTRIKFWGVRGSIPTPGPETVYFGGNTSCVEVRADGRIIILDAGSGLRLLGQELRAQFKNVPVQLTLLITHTHWDHIQGFPFFEPAYNLQNKVSVLGVEGARSGLEGTLSSQMESPFFPLMMEQMPAHVEINELKGKEMEFEIGPVRGQAIFLNHPGVCVGYRLQTSDGVLAYMTDHEPFERLKAQTGKDSGEQIDFARAEDEKIAAFIAGADILIMDSQYDSEEYPAHAGWGHGCVDDVVELAVRAKVKHLFLFHHDPDHDDAHISRMESQARELIRQLGSTMGLEAARERCEAWLPPVEDKNLIEGSSARRTLNSPATATTLR